MPRDIPVGNGSLLVNFDADYQLRDLYWPYVGKENHTDGHPSHFGVWVDGTFRWVHAPGWTRTLCYEDDTLVTHVTLHHAELGLRLECHDLVDFHENLYMRKLTVHDEAGHDRNVRLFFAHDLHISGDEVGDTAYYEPERRAMYHYKDNRWFLINAARETPDGYEIGVDQWAAGKKEVPGFEGTWRDAEDGQLSGNAIAQGSVDSVIALHLDVPANGEATGWYWVAVAEDFESVTIINRVVRAKGPRTFLDRTRAYWALWVEHEEMHDLKMEDKIERALRRSLLIIRTQVDNHGAIIAANDFDIAHYGRDTYSYMWPRDGALVDDVLIRTGYSMPSRSFFNFCRDVMTEEGYLLHKYNPDGTLASSWHPWYHDGKKELPIQEDETALVIWALWRHFDRFRDVEFIKPLYRGTIVRAANWMRDYRDPNGLPLPTWDLWEERRGIHAWTASATWAGLQAAANFSSAFGEDALADGYRKAADGIRAGVTKHMWRKDAGRFVRSITPKKGGGYDADMVLDASLSGLWLFGMLAPDQEKIVATMEAIHKQLWVQTDIGGLARYENDQYHRTGDGGDVPGNPWFICTLWLARWYIARAKSTKDLAPAMDLLTWAVDHALESGVMAEQVHPTTGQPLSVSPLTWSHAALVSAALAYREAAAQLTDGTPDKS
jgi:glucoamylase